MRIPVTVEYAFEEEDIRNLLITAFEGGINYWARVERPAGAHLWECVIVDTEDDGDSGRYVLTLDRVVEGLKTCAKAYPQHFCDFVDETGDATTADVIVQCALLGEIVYG